MAQKAKNQKSTKSKKTAKPAKASKPAPKAKNAVLSKKVKNVKKPGKAPVQKNAKPSPVKKSVPVKNQNVPVKVKNTPVIASKSAKSAKIVVKVPVPVKKVTSVAKAQKGKPAPVSYMATAEELKNLPTIKKPGAGQVQQRRIPGKQQKKVFRTELIFPNQLRETPLTAKPKNKPEPKGKFVLEFFVKSSPTLLFDFLSTPSGLSEWFADDVDIRNEEFTFHWDGQVQRAKLLAYKQDHLLRLRWFDKNEDFYFEFRIDHDDLTGDVTLFITDFGESEDDMKTSKLLWESQVHKLLKVLGAY
jgi:uncharacterized protein YndB with AHSA1/START domain